QPEPRVPGGRIVAAAALGILREQAEPERWIGGRARAPHAAHPHVPVPPRGRAGPARQRAGLRSFHGRRARRRRAARMTRTQYTLVDVFTDTKFGGNQLAVFIDGRGIAAETMQAVAKELNLPETTFVVPAAEGGDRR